MVAAVELLISALILHLNQPSQTHFQQLLLLLLQM